jgi:hypothetical protein
MAPGTLSFFLQEGRLADSAARNSSAIRADLVSGGKRQQRDVPRLLDGFRQAALVRGANAVQPSRNNLAALGHKLLQQAHVAVRNRVDLLRAELADLLAAEELAASAGPAGASARSARAGARSG